MPPDARHLSEASDDEMRALTGTSGMLCDKCGSTGHNTAGHDREQTFVASGGVEEVPSSAAHAPDRSAASTQRRDHQAGEVLPDRGDNLHWLRCVDCGREWAEKDSGAFAKGSRYCDG